MARYVMGDVHGNYKAMKQVLDRCNFDADNDTLIFIGDWCDGYPDSYECIVLLHELDATLVRGNHDQWFVEYLLHGAIPQVWYTQGGQSTLLSFGDHLPLDDDLQEYILGSLPYYELDKYLFVHGGYEPGAPIDRHNHDFMRWNRELFYEAIRFKGDLDTSPYEKVFIGHTATFKFSPTPAIYGNVINVDQGAGWGGRLTVMDIDTEEFWQSDEGTKLYPGYKHR